MPWFRPLASLLLTLALALLPATAIAQSPQADERPVALEPDGLLPLEGTRWRLRDYRLRGIDRSSGPEVAAWMTLRSGKLRASGGCTRLGGSYGVMGSAVDIKLNAVKQESCAEQTMLVQLGMLEGLRRAASYQIESIDEPMGPSLVLSDGQGEAVLRFEPDEVTSLETGEWKLEAYTTAGERVIADAAQPALLAFRPTYTVAAQRRSDGDTVGSTGCNGLVGPYFRYADVLSFGEFERTDAPCSAAIKAQEEAMVGVLDATSLTVSLPPDRLILTSSDTGERLEFVTSMPLEGSTWQLTRLSGTAASDEPITLRLGEGAVTGQGPCGPYSADYATDGRFISFASLEGAGTDACERLASEKALLSALRRTVLLDRDQPQLRLLDARGKILARFKQPGGP